MDGAQLRPGKGWTRARLLQAGLAGGAALTGGALMGARGGTGESLASPSEQLDAKILNLFLTLEYVQEDFYRAAVKSGRLNGDLLSFASAVRPQESDHVSFLTERLGSKAGARPRTNVQPSLASEEKFRSTAIALEEATIAAYIGQAASLTRRAVAAIAPLVSVEARQVAWVRDIAGVLPAPRAADPARKPDDVLADLRKRGLIA